MQPSTIDNLVRISTALHAFNTKQIILQKMLPEEARLSAHQAQLSHAGKMGTPEGMVELREERLNKRLEESPSSYPVSERVKDGMRSAPLTASPFDNIYVNPTLRVVGTVAFPEVRVNDYIGYSTSARDLAGADKLVLTHLANSPSAPFIDETSAAQLRPVLVGCGLGTVGSIAFIELHNTAQKYVLPALLTALREGDVSQAQSTLNECQQQSEDPYCVAQRLSITLLFSEHLPNATLRLLNDTPVISTEVLRTVAARFVDVAESLPPAQQSVAITRLVTGLGRMEDPDAVLEGRANPHKNAIYEAFPCSGETMMPNVGSAERTLFRSFIDTELARRSLLIGPAFSASVPAL